MSKHTTRVMILGIVAYREPISGYGIEKTLNDWAVARWTSIAAASIYHQLRSLTTAGCITPAGEQSGRAVEYVCTAAGRRELHELLLTQLNESDVQPLSLLPLLHFTPTLTKNELTTGLRRRIALINQALASEREVIALAESAGPSHVTEIFRLTWHSLRAERAWCRDFLGRLNG